MYSAESYRLWGKGKSKNLHWVRTSCLMYRSMYSTDCKAKNQLGLGTESLGWCVCLCTVQTAKPKQPNKQKANPKLGIGKECLGWCVGLCTVQTAKPQQTKSQSKTWHWNRMSWLVCGPRYSTDYKAKNKTTTKLDIGTECLGCCRGPCTIQTARHPPPPKKKKKKKKHTQKKQPLKTWHWNRMSWLVYRSMYNTDCMAKTTTTFTLEQNILVTQ